MFGQTATAVVGNASAKQEPTIKIRLGSISSTDSRFGARSKWTGSGGIQPAILRRFRGPFKQSSADRAVFAAARR
jgi:hypothetical protein